MDQDRSTDDRMSYNTTHIYQFFQNVTDDETTQDNVVSFTIGIILWILCPFILTCNGMTIAVVVKFIKTTTPTHVVIAFLGFAGLFVGIGPLSNLALYLIGDSVHSRYISNFNVWVTVVARTLNVSAIMSIAIERCLLMTSWKLYLKYLTVRRQLGFCIAFCVYSFLFTTIFTFMADLEIKPNNRLLYQVLLQKEVVFLVRVFFLPVFTLQSCIIAICYLTILVFLWKHRKTLTSNQSTSDQQNFKKEKKTTVLIVAILTLYMTGTFVPFVYYFVAQTYPSIWSHELFRFISLAWHIISLTDTFIYAWKVPEFQEGYRIILCCLRRYHSNQVFPSCTVQFHGINLPLEPKR